MHTEIERKYLVSDQSFKQEATSRHTIKQAYIAHEAGNSVRIRLRDEEAILTIKGPSANGMSRLEWEQAIPVEDAEALFGICHGGIIDKERYIVPIDSSHVAEVDVFHGENEGLIMAETELLSEDDTIPLPSWIGQEVTGDRHYYNAYLSIHPFTTW